jgi:hypothetical protein
VTRANWSPPASAKAVGVEIDVSSSKQLSDTLDAARLPGRPYFNTLIRIVRAARGRSSDLSGFPMKMHFAWGFCMGAQGA